MGSFVLISVDSRSSGLFARRGFVGESLKFDLGDYNDYSVFCSLLKQLRCKIILDSLITSLEPPLFPRRNFQHANSRNRTKINKTVKYTSHKVGPAVIIFSSIAKQTRSRGQSIFSAAFLFLRHVAPMECKISYRISLETGLRPCSGVMIICEGRDVYWGCTHTREAECSRWIDGGVG